MKPIWRFIVVAFFSFTYLGCTKEKIVYVSQADGVAQELQQVIKQRSPERIFPERVGDAAYFPWDSGNRWSFSNGFIQINYGSSDRSYDLGSLKYYEFSQVQMNNGNAVFALILYF